MVLVVVKSISSYLDKIALKAVGTRKNVKAALTQFDNFVQESEGKSLDEYANSLMQYTQEKQFEILFDKLQLFVNRLDANGLLPEASRNYVYSIKGYLRYVGIKITKEDLRENVTFRRVEKQDREGITKEQLRAIVTKAKPRKKAYYLSMSSSGMRPQESVQLRKRDFDFSRSRIMIRIPAKFTKTKKSRITFISQEAADYLKPVLDRLKDDDLVFGTNEIPLKAKMNEEETFNRIRDKLGFTERYDSGTHKITLGGSLRSWFITKANRVDYGFGHSLAGHDQYMKRYDRLSPDELLVYYLKAEPTLLVLQDQITQDDKDKEIANLKKQQDLMMSFLQTRPEFAKFFDDVARVNK